MSSSERLPSVTVIIAARPEQVDVPAARTARQLDYPADKLEVLISRGRQPSMQRNAALRVARGELVYFLDDDALPSAGNLRLAAGAFADPRVQVLGGPNLCPPDAPVLEQVFALVLGSWLAFGPSRARYTRAGRRRPTTEKELILCNLLARRAALLAVGGFDESLYPNEENALMDRLQEQGGVLLYDPDFVVHRRPRRTVWAFARMLFRYGRGRAEQFRRHPTVGSALNFLPPLFCVYLAGLASLWGVGGASSRWGWHGWLLAPLGLYLLVVAVQMVGLLSRTSPGRALSAGLLGALSHVCYGLGFWRGLFTRLGADGAARAGEVRIEAFPVGTSR